MKSFGFMAVPVLGWKDMRMWWNVGADPAPWENVTDSVMGGGTTSSFVINTDLEIGVFEGQIGKFEGQVFGGFSKITVLDYDLADITGCDSIALHVKSSTPDYAGFKISFGAPGVPHKKGWSFGPKTDGEYKAGFAVRGTDWQWVEIPLGMFSSDCSDYTGRCDTKDPPSFWETGEQHECCPDSGLEPSNPEVCVDSQYLNSVNSLQVWAEGVEGAFNLKIDWIGAFSSSPVQV